MIQIAVVEDDEYLREEMIAILNKEGYLATGISNFDSAVDEILSYSPNLVVLDVNLPQRSGYELCKELKSKSNLPILILTARDTLEDELYALGLGADDFLTKPCHPKRFLARVASLLSIYEKVRNSVQAGELLLDTDTYCLYWRKERVLLPETEGKILSLLLKKNKAIVSKAELFAKVWGGTEFVDENILQVNMTRLRKRLEELGLFDLIVTVRGKGYRLEACDEKC